MSNLRPDPIGCFSVTKPREHNTNMLKLSTTLGGSIPALHDYLFLPEQIYFNLFNY